MSPDPSHALCRILDDDSWCPEELVPSVPQWRCINPDAPECGPASTVKFLARIARTLRRGYADVQPEQGRLLALEFTSSVDHPLRDPGPGTGCEVYYPSLLR